MDDYRGRGLKHLAKAIREHRFAGVTNAEWDYVAATLMERDELRKLAADRRYSAELIGIRVRNTAMQDI